jgi:hypothetical protein
MLENPAGVSLTEILNAPGAYVGQTLAVRGFLYQTAEGGWVLATEPNLKTCCVGRAQHIEIIGNVGPVSVGTIAVVQGRVETLALTHVQLLDASLVSEPTTCPLCVGALLLLGLAVVAVCYVAWRDK